MFSMFQALFMLLDDEKHNFMMNGNLVPANDKAGRDGQRAAWIRRHN